MAATLFVVPASHPSAAARLMLERKRIEYRTVDLVASVHRLVVRAAGFPDATVPALVLDGQRIQGSRRISRALDALVPEPPLFPAEPERRKAVERAEAWGDIVLQPLARRVVWAALRRDRATIGSYLEGASLGVPTALAARASGPVVMLSARLNRASDEAVRADLAALPRLLERVDRWIGEGVLGAEEPNAAGYQIAASLRLLMTLDDVRPALERRPAGRLALELVPRFPGRMPPVLPAAWLAPLR